MLMARSGAVTRAARAGGSPAMRQDRWDASSLFQQVLPFLRVVRGPNAKGEYVCWCVFHPDGKGRPPHHPDLRVRERGYYCFRCKAKGTLLDLARHLGIDVIGDARQPVAVWDYYSPDGSQKLFQKCRFETPKGKTYVLRREAPDNWRECPHRAECQKGKRDCHDGWIWTLKMKPCSAAAPPVLYNQPLLAQARGERVHLPEGEKCCDVLGELGFIAVCNPYGAGEWKPEYSEALRGLEVLIWVDADKAGREHGDLVARSLWGKPTSIRIIDLYPDRSDGSDIADWIAEREAQGIDRDSIRAELDTLVAQASQWQSQVQSNLEASPPTAPDGEGTLAQHQGHALPVIYASDQVLPEVTRQSWAALSRRNDPPRLFRHGGVPVRLERDEADAPVLRELSIDRLRHELARAANWRARKKDHDKWIEVPAKPPVDVVRDVLATPEPPLPVLARIVEGPILGADGTLHMGAGYHPSARVYHAPAKGFLVPDVPHDPTPEDVRAAVDVILDPICDFPFVDAADRAHAVALLLLPFVHDLIDGPTPNHLIEAPTPGCGKGLLAEVLLIPAVGKHPGVVAWTSDDDELRKRITAQLCEGRTAILFDNVTRCLESGVLAAALTAVIWEDRVLGRSEIVRVPVRCAWVTTGNNPTMSTEIARRSVRIRLDPRMDRPWLRSDSDFKHPDLRLWAHEHRGRLIWAALTLARAWLAAGKPHPKQRPLGSYEKWTAVVGGMLEHAGIPGFLANLNEFYELADHEGATWRNFVDAWWDRFREDEVGTSELFPLALEMDGFDLGKGSEQSQRTAFGKQLGKQRDRVIGDHRVVLAGKAKRANRWQLVPIAAQAAAPLESGEHGEHR